MLLKMIVHADCNQKRVSLSLFLCFSITLQCRYSALRYSCWFLFIFMISLNLIYRVLAKTDSALTLMVTNFPISSSSAQHRFFLDIFGFVTTISKFNVKEHLLSTMSILPINSLPFRNKLRYRLLQATALFTLAELSLVATSLGVNANNHSRLASSTFGISRWQTSLRSRQNTQDRLPSDKTIVTNQNGEASVMTVHKTPASKLEHLRAKMKELSLDCYIIPSDDPHLSGESILLRSHH